MPAQKGRCSVCLQQAREYWTEFCLTTQIHGMRYLSENRTYFETIFWALVVIAGLALSIFGMLVTYGKFKHRPLSVNFATRDSPIYHIPFPAVTVCANSKNLIEFNYTQVALELLNKTQINSVDRKNFEMINMMCNNALDIGQEEFFGEDFYESLKNLEPSRDEVMHDCRFMATEYETCSEIFSPVITSFGTCFTFNILDRSELFQENVYWHDDLFAINRSSDNWNNEKGFQTKGKTYPRRTTFGGAENSLSFIITSYIDDYDYMCNSGESGFRVLLHNPLEMPVIDRRFSLFSTNATADLVVLPLVTKTSQAAQSLGVEGRKCYFNSERSLKYFRLYSQENCALECSTNFTLESCQCVDFHMPREVGTKICATKKIPCMEAAKSYVKLDEPLDPKLYGTRYGRCHCLPLCSNVKYSGEISQSEWNSSRYLQLQNIVIKNHPKPGPNTTIHISRLKVFFENDEFLQLEREVIFGVSNLISQLGGLLGLFLGASILSLVEIVYFLTLRIGCNVIMFKNWAGSSNIN